MCVAASGGACDGRKMIEIPTLIAATCLRDSLLDLLDLHRHFDMVAGLRIVTDCRHFCEDRRRSMAALNAAYG